MMMHIRDTVHQTWCAVQLCQAAIPMLCSLMLTVIGV